VAATVWLALRRGADTTPNSSETLRQIILKATDIALRAAECTFNDARENAAERRTFRESAALARGRTIVSDLPIVVISHDPSLRNSTLPVEVDSATNAACEQMQMELSHLSAHGKLIIAKGSGHYIQNDRPDVVIGAIHQIVDRVRQKSD
jgi:hypothetical protein